MHMHRVRNHPPSYASLCITYAGTTPILRVATFFFMSTQPNIGVLGTQLLHKSCDQINAKHSQVIECAFLGPVIKYISGECATQSTLRDETTLICIPILTGLADLSVGLGER